jgi:hypothetical protein
MSDKAGTTNETAVGDHIQVDVAHPSLSPARPAVSGLPFLSRVRQRTATSGKLGSLGIINAPAVSLEVRITVAQGRGNY